MREKNIWIRKSNLLNLTTQPTPKYLWQRIVNFIVVAFLLMLSPAFLQIAAMQKSVWLQILFSDWLLRLSPVKAHNNSAGISSY